MEMTSRWLQRRVMFYQGQLAPARYAAFEGREFVTTLADGKELWSSLQKHSGQVSIKDEDIQSDDPAPIFEYLDQIAREMAESQLKALFQQLDKTCEETGQTVDAKGAPLNARMVLQLLDSVQVRFDKEGKANPLTFVVAPHQTERAKAVLDELRNDPELTAMHDDIMAKKKREWRDREASRKLVG